MKRAVIVAAGSIDDYSFHRSLIKDDYIIAVDGGYDHLILMGVTPDVLIGDFDSIKILPDIKSVKYPKEKDFADSAIAVDTAIDLGYKDLLMLGFIGTRFDHTLANVYLLKHINERGAKGLIKNEKNEICIIDKEIEINGEIGEKLSLIPLSDVVTGISTIGLYYPLSNADMHIGVSIGVSNVLTQKKAKISIKSGLLLCIKSID